VNFTFYDSPLSLSSYVNLKSTKGNLSKVRWIQTNRNTRKIKIQRWLLGYRLWMAHFWSFSLPHTTKNYLSTHVNKTF